MLLTLALGLKGENINGFSQQNLRFKSYKLTLGFRCENIGLKQGTAHSTV